MAGIVLDVDPDDFVAASASASSAARAVSSAASDAVRALATSAGMAGSDPSGLAWASTYDGAAAELLAGLDALETAFGHVSAGLAVTGLNYATAEHLSAGGSGHAPGHSVPSLPSPACSAPPPSAAGGSRACGIPGWVLVANFVGDLWPDGDTGALRRSASAWDSLADELAAVHGGDVPRILQALDTTRTPELPAIRSTVERVASGASALAESASALATGCRDLADRIEHVHRQTEGVLQELLEQVGATALVGVGLTIVTAGLSDAAAGLAAGGEVAAAVARILGFIADFGAEASRLVGTVAASAGRIAEAARLSSTVTVRIVTIAGDTVVTGAGGAATNVGVSLVTDPGGDLESAAVQGFVGGAAVGALGTSVGIAAAARAASMRLSTLRAEMQTWSSAAPASYSLLGTLSEEEWFAKYFAGFSDDGFPEWTWPAHDGFVPGTAKPNTLRVGDVIERISPVGRDGSFATTPGASFESLSLPPDRLSPAFVTTRYRVVLPLGKDVLEGPIAPHFEQPGMAKQYFFPKRMQVLVNAGYLKEVP